MIGFISLELRALLEEFIEGTAVGFRNNKLMLPFQFRQDEFEVIERWVESVELKFSSQYAFVRGHSAVPYGHPKQGFAGLFINNLRLCRFCHARSGSFAVI